MKWLFKFLSDVFESDESRRLREIAARDRSRWHPMEVARRNAHACHILKEIGRLGWNSEKVAPIRRQMEAQMEDEDDMASAMVWLYSRTEPELKQLIKEMEAIQ